MMSNSRNVEEAISKSIEDTRAAYEQVAVVYDVISAPFQITVTYPKIISVVRKLLGSLYKKKILDVGCGSGTLIRMLNEQGAECSGIDLTPAFVELACSRGLNVSEASMHKLPFPDKAFDAIVSNYALNYLPAEGQRLALQENFRVLHSGGVMVFSYMHPFFMRAGRYDPTLLHYPSLIEDYFHPERQETLRLFDQTFILHLLDWPEIVNMVLKIGFRLQELIDAEIPENLEEIISGIKDERIAQFIQSFRYNPYAIFIVGIK